jgi:hypothetical protein
MQGYSESMNSREADVEASPYVQVLPTPRSATRRSRRSKRGEISRASARTEAPVARQPAQLRQRIGHVHVITWKERTQNFLDGYVRKRYECDHR